MARETVKERNLRLMAEANAREEATKQAYPKFLMETLSRLATYTHVYELRVQNELFVVNAVNRNYRESSYRQTTFSMTYDYSQSAQEDLVELAEQVNRLEEERLEEERKANVLAAAQRKLQEFLSAEERELLGL